ncbi:exodeoxyribonuclease V (RecBCD complex)/ beta subunit [Synechococcus sp. RS9909]|uniref:UvrD-helicase domain-containing protein n=1 Tax=unclassified Synechococcus TaxID=2626047 RepID=UPI0000690E60|nr:MULTISPECIES: UvrD-helicase domain-containing protein [unclassified Synechococcus]EAQ68861.1 similar to UvrD/REP helicase [Synechococcus sp. RS9917]QNI78998.1 exodeoxyribonuclease V (RecBCD complex)/ beta subunit [Synechococcus sp. RS9909]
MRRFEHNAYPLDPGVRLLEASAGTGKTFALAHLVLRLITERDLDLNQLLVVTFTDAAAAELRDRIGRRLEQALQGLLAIQTPEDSAAAQCGAAQQEADPVLRDWLARQGQEAGRCRELASRLLSALESLERADITTIHGFCRRTLQRQALQSGQAMDPALESDSDRLCREVAHDYWQQQVLQLEPGDLRGLQAAGLSAEALSQALVRLDGDSGVALDPGPDAPDPEQNLREQFEHWRPKRWQHFVEAWRQEGEALENAFRVAAADWRSRAGLKKTGDYSPKPRKQRQQLLHAWVQQQEVCPAAPHYGTVRAQELLGGYFHPGHFSRVARQAGDTTASLPSPALMTAIADLWDGPAEQVWRHALPWGLAALRQRRERRGVIGFSGLLDALDPATQPPDQQQAVVEALRRRYRVALIDEFQDTDPLQWRLLRSVFVGSEAHLLLMVGDPKQAIYRFRGGDLNTYRRARERADRIDALLVNFRTTAPLMQALNRFMAPGLRHSQLEVPALEARSSAEPLSENGSEGPLQLLDLTADGNACSKTALDEQLPRIVAQIAVDLLHRQPSLQPGDLCILVSKHRQAEAMRRQLAASGLPSRLVSQGDVLATAAAEALQRLLDSLANPADGARLRLLACSALMQWSAAELKAAEDNGQLDRLAQRIDALAAQWDHLGLLGCLAQVMESNTVASLSERGRFGGDLQQSARLVQDAVHRLGLDLASAADWLRRQRLQPLEALPEERQPHSDTAQSAIAVVTVHRSKGLEYPVVICPYLWQEPAPAQGPLWRHHGRWLVALNRDWGAGAAMAAHEDGETRAEAERLAYVAMTRAVRQLILINAQASGQEAGPLQGWLQARPEGLHPLLLPPETPRRRWQRTVQSQELQLGAVPRRPLDRLWGRSSYSAWSANASDPHRQEEGRDRDPEAELDAAAESLPAEESANGPLCEFPRGPAAGDCLHRILERVGFDTLAEDATSRDAIEQELRRAGLAPDWVGAVQQGLQRLLMAPLGGALGRLRLQQLNADRRRHELNFDLPVAHDGEAVLARNLAVAFCVQAEARFGGDYAARIAQLTIHSRGYLTGSIDLVFCDDPDPQSGRWWVADWKSNWLGQRDPASQALACGPSHYHPKALEREMVHHHYPLQAHLYLVALHRFLRWRLPDYAPERHLGGYVYVFLRGLPEVQGTDLHDTNVLDGNATPGVLVETAPVQRILALDRVLNGGQP